MEDIAIDELEKGEDTSPRATASKDGACEHSDLGCRWINEGYRSFRSRNAWYCVLAVNGFLALLSINGVASIVSVNAILSIASCNSVLSIGSLNSLLSVGCSDSFMKICV